MILFDLFLIWLQGQVVSFKISHGHGFNSLGQIPKYFFFN